jgi:electron transport complex protein RnfC
VDSEKAAKMATIQAAMARAKAQREAVPPKNTESLTPQQAHDLAEIEARRTVLEPKTEAPDVVASENPPKAE